MCTGKKLKNSKNFDLLEKVWWRLFQILIKRKIAVYTFFADNNKRRRREQKPISSSVGQSYKITVVLKHWIGYKIDVSPLP